MRSAINRTTQPEPTEQNDNEQQVQTYEEPGKKFLQKSIKNLNIILI